MYGEYRLKVTVVSKDEEENGKEVYTDRLQYEYDGSSSGDVEPKCDCISRFELPE